MADDLDQSLGDAATFAGQAKRRPSSEMSLGDERTLGDAASGQETFLDDIEIVDLEARYKPEGTLGQGGMGAVLLATDTRLDRKVAIKRILGEAAGNRIAVQRFLTEAKSIAALNHPNVVQIYDYGRAKDGPFLIMEYVDGGSLLDKCRGTAIPLEEAIGLACQLCDGLGKAHDLGIIHRDIKPANVLLTKDGIPKLTDFGLAKAETGDHGQTMTGAVLGTPDFMPPEQRRDASLVDHRSDLWSLAATVYQMVTGRSPKIIRFDLLPPELTKVLGKALEDEKDSRYQSARELRDAIKSSVRDSAVAEPSLGEGQCPGCGTKNDSSRRFCRSCGESLEAPCLSCTKPMPMWEEICGQCGSKQRQLVEERRAGMAARQLQAESSLADFDFDRSLQIATSLKDEPDPRLRHLKGWAEQFLAEIDHKRQELLSVAARSLTEALRHEQAFDYSSGIHSLEHLPATVRDHSLPGQQETVASALTRLSTKQAECRRLDSLIKARIAGRQLAGLLPEVEKLLVLRPDRQDVQKLKTQLDKRHQKLVRQRDEAVAKAHKAMAAHDYQGAAAALDVIDRSVITSEAKSLGAEANARWSQVQELASLINAAVAEKRYDGLLGPVEELLQLMPQDQEAQRLRQSLLVREEKTATDVAAIESQADAAWKACQFAQAVKLIERIPESRRSGDVAAIGDACVDMGMTQSITVNALRALTADSDITAYDAAIGQARNYQSTLEQWSLIDKALEESLRRVVEARAALVAEKEQRERQQRSLRLATLSAAVAAVVIVVAMAGLWLRSAYRLNRVASAIAQGRWEDALSFSPDNAQALVGRAKARLAANPIDIAGALSDLDRAEKQPGAEKIAAQVRADIRAIDAAQHAQAGRLDRAGELVRTAKTAGAAAALVTRADEAIVLGWLARGTEAVAKGDAKAVRIAADAAVAAGGDAGKVLGIWKEYAGGRIEKLDGKGLGEAVAEAKKVGLTAEEEETWWIRFGERAAAPSQEKLAEVVRAADAAIAAGGDIPKVLRLWQKYVRGRIEKLDGKGLGEAVVEAKKVGLTAEEEATWWIRFGETAAAPPYENAAEVVRAADAATAAGGDIAKVLRLWQEYIRGRIEKLDGKGLGEAVVEAKKVGLTAEEEATWWIRFGETAAAPPYENAAEVMRAADAAIAAGRQEASVAPLRARGLVLKAVAAQSTGDTKASVDGLLSASLLDAGHVKEFLGEATHAALRAGVVAAYRSRFDAAVAGKDLPEALRVAAAAKTFDNSSHIWVDEAINTLPPAALASLPPATLASLPPATLASLPPATLASLPPATLASLPPAALASLPPAALASLPPALITPLPPLKNSLGMKLKLLPAGRFTMGEAAKSHEVTLWGPFYMGVYEVTNAEWEAVMGSVPSKWKDADRPVEQVSWEEALEFCRRLSALPAEKSAGRVYRLPTEAQWEYACRAGTDTEYSFGEKESRLGEYAWYEVNSGGQTHPVGKKKPNGWGLYDMHGNVWEWCSDWSGEYPKGAVTDPQGPSSGSSRVFRGGSWGDSAGPCQSASRNGHYPSSRGDYLGFRLALSPSGSEPPEAGER